MQHEPAAEADRLRLTVSAAFLHLKSEKCLTKFFYNRKSNTSNGCICPVVPFEIISNTIFLLGRVTTLTTSGQCPLQESIKSALLSLTFGK